MNKNITFYSLLKIFREFNFRCVTPATKIFNAQTTVTRAAML